MQQFVHESRIAAARSQVLSALDDASFLKLVADREKAILCVERPLFKDDSERRHKVLHVFPDLHLPKWIEQRIHKHEPHLEIHYLLCKAKWTEEVWSESWLGTLKGQIHYQETSPGITKRYATGYLDCNKPIIGRFLDRLLLKHILGIQDLEADILRESLENPPQQSALENQPGKALVSL